MTHRPAPAARTVRPVLPRPSTPEPPIHLRHVVIENFRTIRRLAIDLEPRATALIGENNCGKTAALDALERLLGRAAQLHADTSGFPASLAALHPEEQGETRCTLVFRILRTDHLPTNERTILDAACRAAAVAGADRGEAGTLAVRVRVSPDDSHAVTCEVLGAPERVARCRDPRAVLGALRAVIPIIRVRPLIPWASVAESRTADTARGRVLTLYRRLVSGGDGGQTGIQELRRALLDAKEIVESVGTQLRPVAMPDRHLDDLIGTPQPVTTTLFSAAGLEGDNAGEVRLLSLLLLVGAMLDAIGDSPLAPYATPVLLMDDLGAGFHPSWLAATAGMVLNLPLQIVLSTHVGEMLARVPLTSVRRLVRRGGEVAVRAVGSSLRRRDDLRRVGYHIRMSKPEALFARCWLLVEGETEAWLLPEFARLAGIEFAVEGIRCVEFAQCGIPPLVRLADDLGITWRLLTDGDQAGENYERAADSLCPPGDSRVVRLRAPDIEHFLYRHGFHQVYRRAAGFRSTAPPASESPGAVRAVIRQAIKKMSKPALALAVLETANAEGAARVPAPLRNLAIELAWLARGHGTAPPCPAAPNTPPRPSRRPTRER